MNILYIFLQFGASMTGSLSTMQMIVLWGTIVLFVALFFFFLYRTNKIIDTKKIQKDEEVVVPTKHSDTEVQEEEAAAIALAIHMFKSEMHDKESFTITLKKVSKIYSPWSSKIYTLRQNPR
jgi:glutaconyl-CoA/methylmalonyl-CoA decarboxylase subunit delta